MNNQQPIYSYKTIVVFLQTRQWTIAEDTKYGVYLLPPDYILPIAIGISEPDFTWFIPKVPTSTYNRKMTLVLKDISEMYEIPKEDLELLFSKPYEQVKKEVMLMKDMLLYE